ncbi:MAG TPA: hypothetical protein VF550_17280 [Polyangia bacterium]
MNLGSRPQRSVTAARRCALGGFVFALSWLLAAPVADAASKDNRKRVAKTACLAGDYSKGVALLAELYVETNDPMFIFNQGRCFEQNGLYEDAVTRFREYQRKLADAARAPDPEADKHVAECYDMLEKQKASTFSSGQGTITATSAEANTTPSKGEVTPAAAKAPLRVTPPEPAYPPAGALDTTPAQAPRPAAPVTVPAGRGSSPPPEETSMPVQKALGYGAGFLGILGLGTGLAAFLLAQSYIQDANNQGCNSASCEGPGSTKYKDGQTAVLVCNIASVSGGILLIGGLVLVLTSPGPNQTPRTVALVPLLGPGMGQLALAGRF